MGLSLLLCLFVLWLNADVSLSQTGCQDPPPLENGDLKNTMKSQYTHNERVEYMCQNYYTMEGQPFITCVNGEWTGQMRCLKPCTISENAMTENKLEFRYNDLKKMYAAHNDVIEFACLKLKPVGTVTMRQKCNDGVMQLPMCQ